MSASIDTGTVPDVLRAAVDTARRIASPAGATAGDGPQPPADGSRAPGDGDRPSDRQLQDAVNRVSDLVRMMKRDLEFSVDESTGRTVVKVLDAESGEVVRQIPPEEVLAVAENLEEVRGMLFRGTA